MHHARQLTWSSQEHSSLIVLSAVKKKRAQVAERGGVSCGGPGGGVGQYRKKENTVPRQQNMYLWWELEKGGGNKHVQIQMLRKR